jgi:uncharacterized protein (DUF1015 family)
MDEPAPVAPPYVAGPFRLEPFRGLMLAPNRVADPSSSRAFARPFRDVATRLDRWQERGLVHHDDQPALYLHEYTAGGMTIRGLVGALDLSRRADSPEQRVVLPHEGVHPHQVTDLAERMAQMQLNPAPILLVHRGPKAARTLIRKLLELPPDHEFTDRADQRNRVWAVRDPAALATLADALASSRALIADGHHRYAAYLRMQESHPDGPADRGLAMLVDQDDTPFFIGAIHRLLAGTDLDALRAATTDLAEYRTMTETEAVAELAPDTLVVTDGHTWATLRLYLGTGRAAVEVLHEQLLAALDNPPRSVSYFHTVEDTLAALRTKGSVAVLMPAPDYDLVRRAVSGERLLPEKATSFQPKPSLGVLMRSLRDE